MSDKHREELERWQKARGLNILSRIPEGFTFVRPFVVPADDPAALKGLPQFIRRRMETELVKKIQERVKLTHKNIPQSS